MLGLCAGTAVPLSGADFMGIDRLRIRHVIDSCYNLDEDTPEQIAQLRRDYPESLVPEYIHVARLYWLQNYKEVDGDLTAAYERRSVELLEKTQRLARQKSEDVDACFLAALNQLHVGIYHVERQHWWAAFWKVKAGRGAMLRLIKEHPDYDDAKMPLGMADCYLDKTPAYLKPLALLLQASGNMENGLTRLRAARDHGLFTSVDSSMYLAQVHFELRNDPEAARAEVAVLAARFPENPFYQRALGFYEMRSAYREQGRKRLAMIPDMARARDYPALAVRSLMWLAWDCMRTSDWAAALQASERAGVMIDADATLKSIRSESLLCQAEAHKALRQFEAAFACFAAVSSEDNAWRRHALNRIRVIKKEINWKD